MASHERKAHLTAPVGGLRDEFGDVPATMPNAMFVPGPSAMLNQGDPIHYSAVGQGELGRRHPGDKDAIGDHLAGMCRQLIAVPHDGGAADGDLVSQDVLKPEPRRAY